MKKVLVLATLMVFLVAGSASALNISPGDKVTLGTYNNNVPIVNAGGGEFFISTDKGVNFITFCLELTEYLTPGTPYTVQTVAPFATKGSVGGQDPISGATAWLYYMFATGKLASDYGYVKGNVTKGEDALQLAFWKLEGEYTGSLIDGSTDYSYFYNLALGNAWADNDLHGVAVVNPVDGSTDKQSFLILTPEPLTLLLLGLGLIGVAGLRRKEE